MLKISADIDIKALALAVLLVTVAGTSFAQVKKQTTLKAATNAPAPLYINPDGNVGIGTESPVHKLQLNGNMSMAGNRIFFHGNPGDLSSFIQWNLTDAYNGQNDDKMAVVGFHGVKLMDNSRTPALPVLQAGFDITSGVVDIRSAARTGTHPNPSQFTLYVTGPMDNDNGVQFRTSDGTEGIGFGKNLVYQTGNNKNLNFQATGTGNLTYHTNGSERMFIRNDGLVRVINDFEVGGTTRLGGQITLGDPLRNITAVNNDGGIYLEFKNKGSGNDSHGFRFTEDAGSTPILRMRHGFVGIGIDDPKVPLHVNQYAGGPHYDYQSGIENRFAHDWESDGRIRQTAHSGRRFNTCSILAIGEIVSKSSFVATRTSVYSDERLKKNITTSSILKDLDILRRIRVSDYKMIDTIADARSYKKVIAQQVRSVFPQAVSTYFSTLPDVFQPAVSALKQTDSTYLITLAKPHTLKTGDQLELKCNPAADVTVRVVGISDANRIVVVSPVALDTQKDIFVYGHPANDVLTVDYDAISMLNVSATQQLAKTIDEQQREIALLKAQNAAIALENNKLKNEQAETKAAVAGIFARLAKIEGQGAAKPTIAQVK